MGTRFAESIAQDSRPVPGRAARGQQANLPRVLLRLPDLSDSLDEGMACGDAVCTHGEQPPAAKKTAPANQQPLATKQTPSPDQQSPAGKKASVADQQFLVGKKNPPANEQPLAIKESLSPEQSLPAGKKAPVADQQPGHAALTQVELGAELVSPLKEEESPDALQDKAATNGGARAFEEALANATIPQDGAMQAGDRASTCESKAQPEAQASLPLASPSPGPASISASAGATGTTSHTAPGDTIPTAAQPLWRGIVAARRSLRRFEAELLRARKLAGRVASRISAIPWKKVFSLAGWLGLLQQPRVWLTATAAAAAQIVLAMFFLQDAPSRDAGGREVSPARSARAASTAESNQNGLASRGSERGPTEADASAGELKTQLATSSSREAGPTIQWERDTLPRTACRVAVQPEGDGTRGARSAVHLQSEPVRRPGSVQLQGIIQEEN